MRRRPPPDVEHRRRIVREEAFGNTSVHVARCRVAAKHRASKPEALGIGVVVAAARFASLARTRLATHADPS